MGAISAGPAQTSTLDAHAFHSDLWRFWHGKTMIMEKFRLDHPADFDPETGKARTPVLALQMSGKPNERRLYAWLLTALGAPHNPRATIVDLEQKAIDLLKVAQIKVLVIDEVHNLLSGSHHEQRVVLNTLRFLSNELKMSLVVLGSRKLARRSMATC